MRKPSSKGSRLIILHVGYENGWNDSAALVFQSKKATGGYHNEMTSEHFEELFHDLLMQNITSLTMLHTTVEDLNQFLS